MQFAIVDGVRTPPSPNLEATCPVCERAMVARCGTVRVHHWAHRSKRVCDTWWEPETEWHRTWKNYFPADWQEIIGHDAAGEKHIADVRTPAGITLEFQYSHLKPEERAAREAFHTKLAWVVSGSRLQRDYPRFANGKRDFFQTRYQGVYACFLPEDIFPKEWVNSSVPVFFDFQETEPSERSDASREILWGLLPGRLGMQAIVMAVTRAEFVRWAKEHSVIVSTDAIYAGLMEPPPPPRRTRSSSAQLLAAMAQLQRQQRSYARPRRRRF